MAAININKLANWTGHNHLSFSPLQASTLPNHPNNNIIINHHAYLHHHRHLNINNLQNYNFVSIKSKIGVEFRRYALERKHVQSFDTFYKKVEQFHHLDSMPFVIFYTDSEGSYLPINNDDNLAKAISSAKQIILHNNQPYPIKRPFLKLFIEKKEHYNGSLRKSSNSSKPAIGAPEDFRQVSSIIEADKVRDSCRRVRISKRGSDKPLGFYIRDGTYKRINSSGQLEIVTGIFISRLVPGGLAESTGLLAVNDEILEVNGIRVTHADRASDQKNDIYTGRLDQVRDMMVAFSSELIITTRPAKPFNHKTNYEAHLSDGRNRKNFTGRERLPSSQSAHSDLGEDLIRHYMN